VTNPDKNSEKVREKYELDVVDQDLLKRVIMYPAISDAELGAMVGLARGTVNKRRNAAKFKDAMNEHLRPPIERIKKLANACAEKYQQLLNCGDLKIEERVARAVLESVGALSGSKNKPVLDIELIEEKLVPDIILEKSGTVIRAVAKPKEP